MFSELVGMCLVKPLLRETFAVEMQVFPTQNLLNVTSRTSATFDRKKISQDFVEVLT